MRTRKANLLFSLAFAGILVLGGCTTTADRKSIDHAAELTLVDPYTLVGETHLLRGYPPLDSSGIISVVVEIPTGTNAKWEVDKATGQLRWEFHDGKPRIISYLGYPGNYGMVPGTLLAQEQGGDGDPVDVLVLGPAVPRGSMVKARPIGVLKMLDRGEQDDKIIAVLLDSHFSRISSIEELRREFTGIPEILETWFSNYKGPGIMQSNGFGTVTDAKEVLATAIAAYRE